MKYKAATSRNNRPSWASIVGAAAENDDVATHHDRCLRTSASKPTTLLSKGARVSHILSQTPENEARPPGYRLPGMPRITRQERTICRQTELA